MVHTYLWLYCLATFYTHSIASPLTSCLRYRHTHSYNVTLHVNNTPYHVEIDLTSCTQCTHTRSQNVFKFIIIQNQHTYIHTYIRMIISSYVYNYVRTLLIGSMRCMVEWTPLPHPLTPPTLSCGRDIYASKLFLLTTIIQ